MSNTATEIIEENARRDARFNDIRLGIDLEALLREDGYMFRLMVALREDADKAMADFATANCGDLTLIQGLQSRVYRFRYTLEFFESILQRGRVAEHEVRMESVSSERID